MIGAFCAAGFTQRQRLAVLYRQDVHGTIQSFTSIGRKKGLQIEAFDKLDNAMHWLWKETANLTEPKHGTEVPIVKRRQKKRATHLDGERHHHRSVAPKPVRRSKRH
jgi:REP element-mobilizing transposase RayT